MDCSEAVRAVDAGDMSVLEALELTGQVSVIDLYEAAYDERFLQKTVGLLAIRAMNRRSTRRRR